MQDEIVTAVVSAYFESRDFNGYSVFQLKADFGLTDDQAKEFLRSLIDSGKVETVFGNVHPNPHVKAFSGTSKEQQLEWLESLDFSSHFCLYPTAATINGYKAMPDYSEEPYKNEIALGAGQLDFRVFDLAVLEYYRNDPRYYYQTDFINGQISTEDEHFESEEMPEHDQVLLQSFGFAYDDNLNRGVAVFLRYLSALSPEHQKIWKSKQLNGNYQLHPDYLRNSMGHWGTRIPIFEAFLCELDIINEMAKLIGKPKLFRETYRNNTPRNFGFLLRPTMAEFNNFVLLLDQMMSENLNKKFFEVDISLTEDIQRDDGKVEVRRKGTISLLEEWIKGNFRTADKEPLDEMFATFRKVRRLRQKPAHSPQGNEFDQQYFHEQRQLVIDAYNAVRIIRLILTNHPKVQANPPEINDMLYRGEIWSI